MERPAERAGAADRGVAHDLRNLLTAIGVHATLARGAVSDDHAAREDLDELLALLGRARALAIGWLAGPLPEASPAEPVPLDALVADAIPLVRAVAGPGTSIEVLLGTPDPVRIDRLVLERILANLVLNACEATAGPADVLVMTAALPDGRLALTVTDRGPGMPPAIVAMLSRPDAEPSDDPDGHGIGLATVLRLAASAGASLDALPAPSGGTTVRLLLPPA